MENDLIFSWSVNLDCADYVMTVVYIENLRLYTTLSYIALCPVHVY